MSDKDDTLRQFCDVTGADEARSRFFLESSNWQLEVALSSFYEHGGNLDDPLPQHVVGAAAAPALPNLSDSELESPPGSPVQPQKKDKKKPTNAKFATLNSLQQDSSSDEEEASKCRQKKYMTSKLGCKLSREVSCVPSISTSQPKRQSIADNHKSSKASSSLSDEMKEDMETLKKYIDRLLCENSELRKEIARLKGEDVNELEAGQAFYAGGSERSGQQILGPPGKSRKDIVTEMFKSVRNRGAVVFEDEPSTAARGRGGGVFGGVGYRLGATSDDHEQVGPPNTQPSSGQVQSRSVRLRLYREGFTVDSGALRYYSDPQNAEFLSCIRRGDIPPEVSDGSGEVRVNLEDHRHEESPQRRGKSHAFTGKGQMLGSPTPKTVGATVAVAAVAAVATDRDANQRAAQAAVGLDETLPVTTVQFRLADGSRITGRFNHSHTVADLERYVSRAEPAYQLAAFALLTAFPSAELADPGATLAQANVLNTTLLQRMK